MIAGEFSDVMNGEGVDPNNTAEMERIRKEKREKQDKRVKELSEKLINKIQVHVNNVKPYYDNASELKEKEKVSLAEFKERIVREAEDLKYESYGIELLHSIGKLIFL